MKKQFTNTSPISGAQTPKKAALVRKLSGTAFFSPSPDDLVDSSGSQKLNVKSLVHEVLGKDGGYQIRVQNVALPNGTQTRNVLKKVGFAFHPKGRIYRKTKGFYLEDLLVIKKNWGSILKAMTL